MLRQEENGDLGKGSKGCRTTAGHPCGRVLGIQEDDELLGMGHSQYDHSRDVETPLVVYGRAGGSWHGIKADDDGFYLSVAEAGWPGGWGRGKQP